MPACALARARAQRRARAGAAARAGGRWLLRPGVAPPWGGGGGGGGGGGSAVGPPGQAGSVSLRRTGAGGGAGAAGRGTESLCTRSPFLPHFSLTLALAHPPSLPLPLPSCTSSLGVCDRVYGYRGDGGAADSYFPSPGSPKGAAHGFQGTGLHSVSVAASSIDSAALALGNVLPQVTRPSANHTSFRKSHVLPQSVHVSDVTRPSLSDVTRPSARQ